jgi:hypothetical protein
MLTKNKKGCNSNWQRADSERFELGKRPAIRNPEIVLPAA